MQLELILKAMMICARVRNSNDFVTDHCTNPRVLVFLEGQLPLDTLISSSATSLENPLPRTASNII